MGGKFSKAPLIRDVPAALKRKSNKRESAHHLLSPAEALLFNVEDSKSGSSKSSVPKEKEKEKTKDKGKGKAPAGPAAASRDGRWWRATGVLRDDGFFRVFADSDKTVVHSVHLPSVSRTDVHLVDHSLFGRPNCIRIARPAVSPSTPRRASFLHSSSSSTALSRSDDSVYLCFPSIIATQVWLVMAHCFAQPEFYLSSGAATPRPFRSSNTRRGGPKDFHSSSDSGSDSEPGGKADELESSCRIFRSLQVSITEGRRLGELTTEIVRPGPKASWERPSHDDMDLTTSSFESSSLGPEVSPAKSVSSMAMPRLNTRASHDSRGSGEGSSSSFSEAFCEIEMGGEVVAQTAVRKGTSPFWNETFVFSDLPPLVSPITIRVLQSSSKHPTKPLLIGTATVRVPDLPRQQIVEDWWAVKPANPTKSSDAIGELSLSLKINEEVVLPSRDYQEILNLLTDDPEADLASDIALEFPADLEEVTCILLRVYSAKSLLLPRVLRLADLEIDINARNNRSAAILFRGNTILTKTIELYLRLIGAEYLDASIGNVIRRICADKVEIEIDPMKVKPGTKEKDLLANTHALHEWTLALWNSIYDAREKCPHDLRQIFDHIQTVVVEKYGQSEDQKNTRWTCVSAFIFLRFFVPAVLNPKLFFIVSNPPDPKAQRTLTLVAKTLQGLANFSSFGQKEPWMLPMNAFVRENHAALVDFLEHVSTPGPSAVLRQEWTSPNAPAYLAPYRLRSSLSPLAQEGVPLLPHLVDLPRELGALAARVARLAAEKGPIVEGTSTPHNERCETPSIASSRGGRTRQFVDFAEACLDVYSESRRRGGGLVSAATYPDVRFKTPDPKMRAKRALAGRPPTASSSVSTAGLRRSLGLGGTDHNTRAESTGSEDLYIRNPASQSVRPDVETVGAELARTHMRDVSVESNDSVSSRRNHRAFTINGANAGGFNGLSEGGTPMSFSTEDLSLLASLRSSSSDDVRDGAVSPSPLPTSMTLTSLAGYANPPSRPSFEASQVYASRSIPAANILAPSEYAFPPNRSPKPSATPSVALSTLGSIRTSSTSRSSQLVSPVAAPTSRIRITQETTTTTSYVSEATTALSFVNGNSPVPVDDDFSLSPTSHEDGTPFESSFGGFSAPLMRAQTSQTSAHSVLTVLSGRSLTASSSSVSISAEVSSSGGGAAGLSGRRASTAGFSSFGLGGSGSRRGGPADRGSGSISGVMRDDESEGGSSMASSGKGGLLSRAMGRKGSRAS
ncbi:ras GTPase-activating protein 1 [Rhodotorula toruloides]|uniref:Ras GTPase-activating protein 1 n=1 Tax=Rhodotorula toruloides TaxID=5286 RepID=A0A511KHI2_RHOTO|nr:ras GTPase-activating protein 1 [Rhodotorula toruloides]